MMLQNNACEKELFKMQGQIRDFYVTEIKMFVDKLSDSTLMLQTILTESRVVSKRIIHKSEVC